MPNIGNLVSKIFSFITHDIWHLDIQVLSKRKAFWVRQLKVGLITLREFNNGKVNVQASSLSFYLIVSIVPIAGLMFAVSSGFGIEEQIKNWLTELLPEQQDVVDYLLSLAKNAIDSARGGWLAGVGIVILLWSSLNMFVQIEEALNSIWHAKRSRSWTRRFADYMSIMLIAPVLLILSNSITVTFRFYIDSIIEEVPIAGSIAPILFTIFPLLLVWIIFTLLYVVMPNVKVRFMPALISAIIAGTVFYYVEQLYIYSQVSLSKYNAIYGSLAAIPLFLLCAKIGWQIVLFGAELSFAYQNIDSYEHEMLEKDNISHHNLSILSLYVLKSIIKGFETGDPPKPLSVLSEESGLSIRSLNVVTEALIKCGMLLEVNTDHKDDAFVPAMDINKITVGMVLKKLDGYGDMVAIDNIPVEMEYISEIMNNINQYLDKKEGQIKIVDI